MFWDGRGWEIVGVWGVVVVGVFGYVIEFGVGGKVFFGRLELCGVRVFVEVWEFGEEDGYFWEYCLCFELGGGEGGYDCWGL